ncbi:MAG TPA: 6-phosphofructokinase, partial [Taishania sp.]|nr:6-phosphofructokinase [Taishania sp.]
IDAIDKIRDTASSHHRIFFVEVMGRDAGFIALNAAIASGAEAALIPEEITNLDELACQIKEYNKGKRSSIIIVSEGDDAGDAMTIMNTVKPLMPEYDLRCTVLGHIQRGGNPTAKDRIIATKMGAKAVELLIEGKSKLMVGVDGENITILSIEEAIKKEAIPNLEGLKLIQQLRTKR